MGGAVSTGEDNDDLIDNLIEADCIKTPSIEAVFRAVDRADYYLKTFKEGAYKDVAWKHGHLHLSAPCIYSEVMEALNLEPGLSFLNVGSGSGYVSTMAGLILGTYGVNHGVELYQDVVDHAYDFLDNFKKNSPALNRFDFCEPQYFCGNALLLDSSTRLYDRIYCGAGCPEEQEIFFKGLLKIGGILVVPTTDFLWQVCRIDETSFQAKKLLSVTFASLVIPNSDDENKTLQIDYPKPLKLSALCRYSIRSLIRQQIEHKNPGLKRKLQPRKKRRRLQKVVLPIMGESTEYARDSDDGRDPIDGLRSEPRLGVRNYSLFSVLNHPNRGIPSRGESSSSQCENSLSDAATASSSFDTSPYKNSFTSMMLDELYSVDGEAELPAEAEVSSVDEAAEPETERTSAQPSDSDSERKLPCPSTGRLRRPRRNIFRKIGYSSDDSDDPVDKHRSHHPSKRDRVASRYTLHMVDNIKKLPLPTSLKKYVNYGREL